MLFRFLLLLFLFAPLTAQAAKDEVAFYRQAFSAVATNNPQQIEAFASRGDDPILNKVLRAAAMAMPDNGYNFEQLNAFIAGNPGWPGLKGIQMIAEQKIPAQAPAPQVTTWFAAHPPVSLAGFYRYIDALNQSGRAEDARAAIRKRWVEGDFSGDQQTAFSSRFSPLIDSDSLWARMDRLLWKGEIAEARRLMPSLNAKDQALALTRIALATQDSRAWTWLEQLSPEVQKDPGILYLRLKWDVKAGRNDAALEALLHPPADLGDANAWGEQRQIMIRRAMEKHDYPLAYQLAAHHGLSEPKNVAQAEFLAGWIALRLLSKPEVALKHFQALDAASTTPISQARAGYWLGRTQEALGDPNAAEQAYEGASVFNTTYYGQLALTRLYAEPQLLAKADPPLPESVRHTILTKDMFRAIERLAAIGETARAQVFFHAAGEAATARADFVVLAEIAARIHRPDLGIQAVKAAAHKNMMVENGGFPLLLLPFPSPPEPAFTHALIRQESLFNAHAQSGVGARGLMQLMPATAREVARKMDLRYTESLLEDPAYNIKLGTHFVQDQIDKFGGSYIMALAGYNAGPGRVHEWIATFGDPRSGAVDPVDWIELIPIQETRTYVQRIIESTQVYRARLNNGTAPLKILKDLGYADRSGSLAP